MAKKICVHPRKMINVMTKFVNDAIPENFVTCIDDGMIYVEDDSQMGMHTEQAFEPVYATPTCKIYKNNFDQKFNMCACLGEFEPDVDNVMRIEYCHLNTYKGGGSFYQNFVSRCPLAKGFAEITLTCLHELGHFITMENVPTEFNREMALKNMKSNQDYYAMPDETLATNWAIEWLQDANNRKLAKAFEKKFFACFE